MLGSEIEILETYKGTDLEYMEYEQLIPALKVDKKAFYVTIDDYVTAEDGTGIVHIAPAFGEDDAKVGKKYDLPYLNPVGEDGCYIEGPWKGMLIFDADKEVIKYLKENDKLFKKQKMVHNYPHCWRCDSPLVYYSKPSYYLKVTEIKDQIIEANKKVNWYPSYVGEKRFGNWLENMNDWAISRSRYWGTPLPYWNCECGHDEMIGSRKELVEKAIEKIDETIDLHRPFVDNVHIKCPKCGKSMTRTKDVIDCWFDSGSMPFAQYHWPFENADIFEDQFPADFICEGIDQTRGWFYTLEAISTLLFDKAPFKNCIVLGHVNDKDGIKMSKHKGNVVDPWTVLDKQGADAVRWYFYTGSSPWLPSRFSAENVSEAQRKFMGTLWNTYAFFVLYANIDKYDPTKYDIKKCKLSLMDKWILSKLQTLITEVDSDLNEYKITESSRAIGEFTDELSNWYVRRCRDRFWGSDMSEDKISAYTTLHTTLVTLSKVIAPFVPFIAETIYQNLVVTFDKKAPESVHLCDFPVADKALIDIDLEKDMSFAISSVELGRAARNASNMKNRQPLSNIYIKADIKLKDNGMLDIIAKELNIKKAQIVENNSSFVGYEIKPQLKTIGPKYGKLLGGIKAYLASCDSDKVVSDVENGTHIAVIDGNNVEFAKEDLLISTTSKAGMFSESDKGITVTIDTNLTDELIREGVARELVSKIQTMRKEAGFEVTDHINIGYVASGLAEKVLAKDSSILADVLADSIVNKEIKGYTKDWNINGDNVTLYIAKV